MPKNGITARELAAQRREGYCSINDIQLTYDGVAYLPLEQIVAERDDGQAEVRLQYGGGTYIAHIDRMDVYRQSSERRNRPPQGALRIDLIVRSGKTYNRWPKCLDYRTVADVGPEGAHVANRMIRHSGSRWTCPGEVMAYDYPLANTSPVKRGVDGYVVYSGGTWCPLELT